MKSIAERKPGRTRLVYDKTKRTNAAVAARRHAPRAHNITADDADMVAVVTHSSQWLGDNWGVMARERMMPIRFSSWDDGDAYTRCELGTQRATALVEGMLLLDEGTPLIGSPTLRIVLAAGKGPISQNSTFVAP